MNEEQRIKVLEEELKVIKNEVKTVLLDIREQYLNLQNPFNSSMQQQMISDPDLATQSREPNLRTEVKSSTDRERETGPAVSAAQAFFEPERINFKREPALEPDRNNIKTEPALRPTHISSAGDSTPSIPVIQRPSFGPESIVLTEPSSGASYGPETQDTVPNTQLKHVSGFALAEAENGPAPQEEDEFPAVPSILPNTKSCARKNEPGSKRGNQFDLIVIAGLTQWMDQVTLKLGKEKAETLVEMAFAGSLIPENFKDIMVRMARLSRNESSGQTVSVTDYLSMLAQLENLLYKAETQDKALLSLLSIMKDER